MEILKIETRKAESWNIKHKAIQIFEEQNRQFVDLVKRKKHFMDLGEKMVDIYGDGITTWNLKTHLDPISKLDTGSIESAIKQLQQVKETVHKIKTSIE